MKKRIAIMAAACALLLCLFFTPVQAVTYEPAYGTGIVVDGDPGEWDLGSDFFASMYNAGKPDSQWPGYAELSDLYLRYDTSDNILYALVLDNMSDGKTPDESAEDAWLKVYNMGWPNNKLIDGDGEGNTTPRGFEWVYETPGDDSTPLQGYEAYAQLDAGIYDFEAHLNIDGDTSSTGKDPISLKVVPIPGAVWLFASGLIGLAGIRRKFKK